MKRIFKTVDDHLTECTTLEKGCWVHLQSPTKEEVDGLNARFALDPTFLAAAAKTATEVMLRFVENWQ